MEASGAPQQQFVLELLEKGSAASNTFGRDHDVDVSGLDFIVPDAKLTLFSWRNGHGCMQDVWKICWHSSVSQSSYTLACTMIDLELQISADLVRIC